jgi:hypothetical protein
MGANWEAKERGLIAVNREALYAEVNKLKVPILNSSG